MSFSIRRPIHLFLGIFYQFVMIGAFDQGEVEKLKWKDGNYARRFHYECTFECGAIW